MTAANLDGPARAAGASAPRAVVDLTALALNARIAVDGVEGEPRVGDIRADAWGHGAAAVARVLRDAGADALRLDDAQADPGEGGALSRSATPNLDPRTVFGLPDGAPDARPALTLRGSVLSVKPLRAGEGVSYGYRHRAAVDTRIALVTGGYAQGIVRSLGNRVEVAHGARRHPIVGRVAMDVCVVDIGDAVIARGDEVVFFGDPATGAPSLADWVRATGLSAGEIVAVIGARAAREYVS